MAGLTLASFAKNAAAFATELPLEHVPAAAIVNPTALLRPASDAEFTIRRLRTDLAVRGWADPALLLPDGITAEIRARVLEELAPDVETAVTARPGEWYLNTSVRRRVLEQRTRAELVEALTPRSKTDWDDPVRGALEVLLAEPAVHSVSDTDLAALRALLVAIDWLGDRAVIRPELVMALIAAQERREDVARLSTRPLIGRDKDLRRVVEFMTRPSDGIDPRVLQLYGVGGSGKSMLLARAEAELAHWLPDVLVVYLDFDRADLDPTDPYSIDFALLDQIAAAIEDARPRDADGALSTLDMITALSELRTNEETDRARYASGKQRQRPARKINNFAQESMELESVMGTEDSRRHSLLYGVFAPHSTLIGGYLRLVIVLDTLETVVARGSYAVSQIASWLHSLTAVAGAEGLSIVLAGRDAPEQSGERDVGAILAQRGYRLEQPPIALGELSVDDAVALLRASGVSNDDVACAAAIALPRLPLLLVIAADVLARDSDAADAVRTAHREGRIDTQTASAYLTTRILRHVPEPIARDYLLSCFALPQVTERLVREVIAPIVDQQLGRDESPENARRLFATLKAAPWLWDPTSTDRTLYFQPALRSLALKLIAADPNEAALNREVRVAAHAFYMRGRQPDDAAFAVYQRLMLGEPMGHVADCADVVLRLRRVLDDLPEAARAALTEGGDATPQTGVSPETDAEWRIYLEGAGNRGGQGAKLVQRGEGELALELYCDRPTRRTGVPPDFVIQALAYTGHWDSDLVSRDMVLDEIEARAIRHGRELVVPANLRARLYWLTRLELLRAPGPLEARHEKLLAAASADISATRNFALYPSIVAVAEAFAGKRIGPIAWLSGRGEIQRVTRYPLVQALRFGTSAAWRCPLDGIVVLQRDWAARVTDGEQSPLVLQRLRSAQNQLDSLDGAPLVQVSTTLRALQQQMYFTLELKGSAILMLSGQKSGAPQNLANPPEIGGYDIRAVSLARGKTTEFLRPLAAALAKEMARDPDRVSGAIAEAIWNMSIAPKEMRDLQEATREPVAWASAAIDLLDLARVLPTFCRALADRPPTNRLGRIARTFLLWDEALCAGGSSDWNAPRPSRGSYGRLKVL